MPNTTRSNSSSHLSPTSAGSQPTWGPPRAPLPPHRLAKLANALGVSTPTPATQPQTLSPTPATPLLSPSPLPSPNPESIRRSPTPSLSSQPASSVSTSKYYLEVIPPTHLPHDFDDPELNPPPPSASGYHVQFRRGVLVPVYPTLQLQLGAVAKKYALPSTVGMVLYLITTPNPDGPAVQGPRITDDVWKHVWTRVLKAEADELLTPGIKPLTLYGWASRSSPALHRDVIINQGQANSARSLMSPRLVETPQPAMTPVSASPSTPSRSAYSSRSDVDTPESATSVDPPSHANSLPLPGLNSNDFIPILAKFEFDIDKRKAGWYNQWVRSRKMNHAKRSESRLGRSGTFSEKDVEEGEEAVKRAPLGLALVGKMNGRDLLPNFLLTKDPSTEPEELDPATEEQNGYQQLDDDHSVVDDEELTARLNQGSAEDPLEDVFGNDADNWAEMRAASHRNGHPNPKVVDLALDAEAISRLPDDLEEDDDDALPLGNEEAEVTALLDRMSKPSLSVSIPDGSPPSKRRSSPTTAGTIRKHVPPPLHLLPAMPSEGDLAIPEQASPFPSSADSTHLAYLTTPSQETIPDDEEFHEESLVSKVRSPEDEKREGGIFEDLNLGLDPSLTEDVEFDESDPYDRRKSQYILSAQLDEIEKNLAQFSPRHLQSEELTPEDLSHRRIRSSASTRSPSIASALSPRLNAGGFPSPPKSPMPGASWPAVPYSVMNSKDEEDDSESRPPSPPKFAINGISTDAPKQFTQSQKSDLISDETLARQRALQEDRGLYPPLVAPAMFTQNRNEDSPVIPLSPDPFGRYPSEPSDERQSQLFLNESGQDLLMANAPDRGSSLSIPTTVTEGSRPPSQTPSSRFSLDSVTSEEATKAAANNANKSSSLMSVKSIRRLWRKSDSKRSSISSSAQQPESGRTSPNAPVANGQPVGRSRSKSISKTPPIPSPIMESANEGLHVPPMPSRESSREPSLRILHFDQESPYPVHPSRAAVLRSPSPPPPVSRPPSQQTQRPPSVQQQAPQAPSTDKSSVRKSILKSWKSHSSTKSSSSTPRSSTEQPPETARKRRPSVLDIATGRGSMSSGSATLVDLPPSPAIPEQFAIHARSASRQSQLTLGNGRPSMSSTTSSPPRVKSPLMTSSPPRNGLNLAPRASRESYESQRSFDVSQFEMVSPPKTSLSYPYHGLDQSMVSQESG